MPRPRWCLLPATRLGARLVLSLLPLAVLAAPGCSRMPGRPPDIVLISLDSVRADDLTFRDESAAPALAALARRGTIFRTAIAGSSWTLPSHAEIFTGSPPELNGVQQDTVAMDPEQPTLPELLRTRGYRTAGLFSGGYLDPRYGFGRGFDSYEDCQTAAEDAHVPGEPAGSPRPPAPAPAAEGAEGAGGGVGGNGISGPTLVERAETVLAKVPAEQPLFLFVHDYDPHYDYIPPPPYETQFDPGYEGDLDARDYWHNKRIYDASQEPPRQVSDRDLEHVRALYRGEIAWSDSNVGRLLDALARHGRLANAVIVVTSDHGEEFFEHGNRGHRNGLHDEVLRVPLLIVPPVGDAAGGDRATAGRPKGCVEAVDAQVSLSDIAPTLLEFAGVSLPPTMSGRPLRAACFGAKLDPRSLFSSLIVPAIEEGKPVLWRTESLRRDTKKFVLVFRYAEPGGLKLRGASLYDLRADPGETSREMIPPSDPRLGQQWEAMERTLDELRARYAATRHASPGERLVPRMPEADANLHALGYAGGAGEAPALALPWGPGPRPRLSIP